MLASKGRFAVKTAGDVRTLNEGAAVPSIRAASGRSFVKCLCYDNPDGRPRAVGHSMREIYD